MLRGHSAKEGVLDQCLQYILLGHVGCLERRQWDLHLSADGWELHSKQKNVVASLSAKESCSNLFGCGGGGDLLQCPERGKTLKPRLRAETQHLRRAGT
jgi:hypothetical protein